MVAHHGKHLCRSDALGQRLQRVADPAGGQRPGRIHGDRLDRSHRWRGGPTLQGRPGGHVPAPQCPRRPGAADAPKEALLQHATGPPPFGSPQLRGDLQPPLAPRAPLEGLDGHPARAPARPAGLGSGYDAVLVANVIHDFNEKENRALLKRVRDAIRPGGKVFIVEFFLDDSLTRPAKASVFSVMMYKFTASGRCYSWRETEGWLKELGFGRFTRRTVTPEIGTLEATRL